MNTGRLTINRVNSGRFAQSYLKVSSAESRAGWNGPKNIFPCLTISDFNNFRFEWHFKNFSFYFDFEKICPQANSKRYDLQKCQKSDRVLQGRKVKHTWGQIALTFFFLRKSRSQGKAPGVFFFWISGGLKWTKKHFSVFDHFRFQ